jgi:hypothetical protein
MIVEVPLSPVDMVQEFVETVGWNFARQNDHLITYEYTGLWSEYTFSVADRIEQTECIIQCGLPFTLPVEEEKKPKKPKKAKKVPKGKKLTAAQAPKVVKLPKVLRRLNDLFGMIHEDITLGYFSFRVQADNSLVVHWTYRLQVSAVPDEEVLERALREAYEEIDEFYPSIALVLTGTVSVDEAYTKAIPPCYGNA